MTEQEIIRATYATRKAAYNAALEFEPCPKIDAVRVLGRTRYVASSPTYITPEGKYVQYAIKRGKLLPFDWRELL